MNNSILKTEDNSHTIFSEALNAHYHSIHGAIEEATHVFISAGLFHLSQRGASHVNIFEMGLGTGLNALLTYIEAINLGLSISYHSIESHPISKEQALSLNYPDLLHHSEAQDVFNHIHEVSWDTEHQLSDSFTFTKSKASIESFSAYKNYDLIYYDAFAPSCQQFLWEEAIHSKLYNQLNQGGALVTYCSQGAFRRMLQSLGYHIERLNGPARKREMIRATKYL